MRILPFFCSIAVFVGFALAKAQAQENMRLVNNPSLSPDGKQVVFGWNGDIWSAPTTGGMGVPLTTHSSKDDQPAISPDGKTLAFVSDREGSPQLFLMPLAGGPAKQVTFHTAGYKLLGWTADGKKLLAQVVRDYDWTRGPDRMVLVDPFTRKRDELLFDTAGKDGSLSPDNSKVLFVREGTQWWRKGYYGTQAWQIWNYDRATEQFTRLLQNPPLANGPAVVHARERGSLAPIWKPDGKGFYYVGGQSGSFNLWEHNLTTGDGRQLTHFTDDSVVQPSLSADGSTIVFRHLFDLYVLRPATAKPAEKINIVTSVDRPREKLERRTLSSATSAAFTSDGLEIAFIAGGDVWVMDTELKEPKQVTRTPEEERSIAFSPDNNSLYFVSDANGKTEIIKTTKGDSTKFWWQNDSFNQTPITTDGNQKSSLQFNPDGTKLALVLGRGDLAVIDADGKNGRVLSPGYSAPDFDWSPDGKWLAFSRQDSDFNSDIYIQPLDGSRPAFNVSRHPDNEGEPTWSPDGKVLAFTGRRVGDEVDIHYLYLRKEDDEVGSRDRALEKAIEKMKSRKPASPSTPVTPAPTTAKPEPEAAKPSLASKPTEGATPAPKTTTPAVVIDFDRMNERLRTLKISDSAESNLFWSPDSKKLGFSATVNGIRGTYYVEFPDTLTPKLLNSGTGTNTRWLKTNSVVWLASGVPASFTPSVGGVAPPSPAASVISRMGRTGPQPATATAAPSAKWSLTTVHPGLLFDEKFPGPGWKIRSVLTDSPAAHKKHALKAGEIVLKINGKEVTAGIDPSELLTVAPNTDLAITVRDAQGKDRQVAVRPISYAAAKSLLYPMWITANRQRVDQISKGTMGYLHIEAMDQVSFEKFEEALYDAGAGKQGLIIDVRENGGGSTADLLLTALTQPVHAVTIPRGGSTPGYPHDRKVFATWNKPIVVLCNQNSFSNAEIFSHAIKTLKRGKLVGVATAGGVISTGGTTIMDVGFLRLPFRGWYLTTNGEDLEMNGAEPDVTLWPEPQDKAKGIDRQLEKGVEILQQEVTNSQTRIMPAPRKASQR